METTKKLSQVRQGETIQFPGRSVHQAATDAEVVGQKVAVSWVGGGGCFLADEEVLVLNPALQALRAIPTEAASIGAKVASYPEAIAAYETAAHAARPEAHANFQTTLSQFVMAQGAAAQAAENLASWYGKVAENSDQEWFWTEVGQGHRAQAAQAWMS